MRRISYAALMAAIVMVSAGGFSLSAQGGRGAPPVRSGKTRPH